MGYRLLIVPQKDEEVFRMQEARRVTDIQANPCQIRTVLAYLPDFNLWSVTIKYKHNATPAPAFVQYVPTGWKEVPAP